MKVSLNWLRELVDIQKTPEEIADILTSIGLEVEAIEPFETIKGGLKGCVVGHIVEHEKLAFEGKTISLNKVDVGAAEPLQVICGAPNAALGLKICMALPGTELWPGGSNEPFRIGERKTYGHLSQGMICAEDELGLGQSHAGIMVLPQSAVVGMPLAEHFKIASDIVIEVGLTPNRSDATSMMGIARDVAACLRVREKGDFEVKTPQIDEKNILQKGNRHIEIEIDDPSRCPRYAGLVIEGLKVGPSPDWLRNRLEACGERSINNVVDATNLVRLEMGQPLHAFDLDKIERQKIIVRTLPEGSLFVDLTGTERKLFAEDLMICNGASKPMCMGGVFGGLESGVSEGTTAIFLESAHFSPSSIRRSMTRHNLRTEAAKIFEKTSDPSICLDAARRAASLIIELAGGQAVSELFDFYPKPIEKARVSCSRSGISRLIGVDFSMTELERILTALAIGVEQNTAETFVAIVPTDKADVQREADIAEEILRMIGTDAVPMPGRVSASIEVTPKPDPFKTRELASELLVGCGLTEIMALSLSNSTFYQHFDEKTLVFVNNTANQGLDVLRPSMLFGGLDAIERNQNRQNADLKLFEFGKTYRLENGSIVEKNHLALFLTGAGQAESWQKTGKAGADFFTLKSIVQNLFARLGAGGFQESVEVGEPFRYALKMHRGPQTLAVLGLIAPSVSKKMGIKAPVFYADIDWDALLRARASSAIKFKELNRFPTVRRDLALVLEEKTTFGEIKALAAKTAKKLLKEVNLFDVFEDSARLGAGKKSYAVSFVFEDAEKTLQETDIETAMAGLQRAFEEKLGATIRK